MNHHACLADPDPARFRTTPGDQFDCPACRVVLLQSFREPASAPAPPPGTGCLEPELCTAADPCPVCETDAEGEPDDASGPVVQHRTSVSAHPFFLLGLSGGGCWYVNCSCGWRLSGLYGLDSHPVSERDVVQRAESAALDHAEDPGRSVGHVVTSLLAPETAADGFWLVHCTCGWIRSGVYGSAHAGEHGAAVDHASARTVTQRWAEHHRQNPIRRQP